MAQAVFSGDNALILASKRGLMGIVKLLLEHKADIDAKNHVRSDDSECVGCEVIGLLACQGQWLPRQSIRMCEWLQCNCPRELRRLFICSCQPGRQQLF